MPFQFVDDNIQAFCREHQEVTRALEQYFDEQNITLQKLLRITESEVEKKPSQAYQAFLQQLAQSLVQQQNRVLSLVLTTAMARVVERKQESVLAAVNPRDADVPPDMRSILGGKFPGSHR